MERFGLYDQTLCEVRGISVVLSVLTDAHCSKGESARVDCEHSQQALAASLPGSHSTRR